MYPTLSTTRFPLSLSVVCRLTIILIGGWVLRHKLDQEAAENLLQDMEAKTGWDVAQSIQALRGLWNEEDSDN